jgi:Transposase IS116/IS110/IS902 family
MERTAMFVLHTRDPNAAPHPLFPRAIAQEHGGPMMHLEAIRLRSTVTTIDFTAGRIHDDVLHPLRPSTAGVPEPIPAGLITTDDAGVIRSSQTPLGPGHLRSQGVDGPGCISCASARSYLRIFKIPIVNTTFRRLARRLLIKPIATVSPSGFPIPPCKSIEVDLALIGHYDQLPRDVELSILKAAKQDDANTLYWLRTVPGIGGIRSLVLLYEMHDIQHFPQLQEFVSYCRLVKCAKESAGKRYGTSGTKIGNAYLKWAFSEAAVLFLRNHPHGRTYLTRLEKKHGKGKALTVLAHKLARAVYHLLQRHKAFDIRRFLQS